MTSPHEHWSHQSTPVQYLATRIPISSSRFERSTSRSDTAFNEGPKIESNISRIQKTKPGAARLVLNPPGGACVQSVAAINTLPIELLIQIFSLLVNTHSCLISRNFSSYPVRAGENYIHYPDSLLLVCSSWRSLMMGVPYFWTHIDIVLGHPLISRFNTRAKVFSLRAGAAPLEIHLYDSSTSAGPSYNKFLVSRPGQRSPTLRTASGIHLASPFDFRLLFSLPTTRIKTLDITFVQGPGSHHASTLQYFLGSCTPGILTQCSIKCVDYSSPIHCIEPMKIRQTQGKISFSVPNQQLEQLWLHTTTLRLDGICPPWSSKAYHGLIELHLGGGMGSRIPESSLVHILNSSPELRFLYLRIGLDDPLPLDNLVEPVHLDYLEELDIMGEDSPGYSDKILRWISPGPKPLQFNFVGIPSSVAIPFCARSRINRFYGEQFVRRWDTIADMIHQSPRLEVLALNAHRFEDGNDLFSALSSSSTSRSDLSSAPPSTKVHTLYLLNFVKLPFQSLQDVVSKCSVQRLLLRNTSISYETTEGQVMCACPQEIRTQLSTETHLTLEYLTKKHPLDLGRWR